MQTEESFSEGDSLNVTTAELAAMGAENVTTRRGRLSSDDRRMTQALAERQEGMEETLSQLDERVSGQESQLVESVGIRQLSYLCLELARFTRSKS